MYTLGPTQILSDLVQLPQALPKNGAKDGITGLAADHDNRRVRLETEFDKIERKQRSLMDAIMDGTPALLVNADLAALEARRAEIEAQLQAVPPPLPRLHPNLPDLYRRKVEDLQEALLEPETITQAALALRGRI